MAERVVFYWFRPHCRACALWRARGQAIFAAMIEMNYTEAELAELNKLAEFMEEYDD